MNKADTREVNRALDIAGANPGLAAASIATVHREATKATQRELVAILEREGLMKHLVEQNGCLVPCA